MLESNDPDAIPTLDEESLACMKEARTPGASGEQQPADGQTVRGWRATTAHLAMMARVPLAPTSGRRWTRKSRGTRT